MDDLDEIFMKASVGEYGKVVRDSFKAKYKKIEGNTYGVFCGWLEEEGRYETFTDSYNNEHFFFAKSGKYIKVVVDDEYYDKIKSYKTKVIDKFDIFGIEELSGIRMFYPNLPIALTNAVEYKKFFEYIVFEEKEDVLKKYGMSIRNPKNDYMGDVASSLKGLVTDEEKKYIEYGTLFSWGWNNSYTLLLDFRKYLEFFYFNIELKEKLFAYRNSRFYKRDDMTLENALFTRPTPESFAAFMLDTRANMRKIPVSVNYVYK